MQATGHGPQGLVDLEEPADLVHDVVEATGLVPAGRGDRVAVHRVADPGDLGAGLRDPLDERGQGLADRRGAHARDERQPARFAVGVDLVDERERVVDGGLRPQLDPDGVADPRGEVHVRTVELTGALPDPDHVRGDVVGTALAHVLGGGTAQRRFLVEGPGHRALVVEQERLVAGPELDGLQGVEVGAAGGHELHGLVDVPREGVVLGVGRGGREAAVPLVDLAQVRVAAGRERPDEVQRRGRRVVGPEQALRVGDPRLGGERVVVDGVAAVGGQGDAVAGLVVAGTRLGELPRHPADLDDGQARAVGQDGRHLQHRLQPAADAVGRRPREGLGAVPALEQERLAPGGLGQLPAQLVGLTREDQGGIRRELRVHLGQRGGVRPLRLLGGGQVGPRDAGQTRGVRRRGSAHAGKCRTPRGAGSPGL